MSKIFVLPIISVLVFILACNQSAKKTNIKKEYYSSGKIKSIGYYLNDSIPIDTIKSYYESGALQSVGVYDSLGKLNGISLTFYENGALKQKLEYINGLTEGVLVDYDSTGSPFAMSYYFNDKMMGDYYLIRKNKIFFSAFYDFKGRKINQTEYDSSGNILNNVRQKIFLDSISTQLDHNNIYSYKILLIVSNPLRVNNKLSIQYIGPNNNIISIDSIEQANKHSFLFNKKFTSNLNAIRIEGVQYDSILSKSKTQTSQINIDYSLK